MEGWRQQKSNIVVLAPIPLRVIVGYIQISADSCSAFFSVWSVAVILRYLSCNELSLSLYCHSLLIGL